MSRRDGVKRVPSRTYYSSQQTSSPNKAKRTERTPLLDSVSVQDASVNTSNKPVVDIQTGVSWGVAAFLLVNTALGAGMLNYPYAYNQIGGVMAAALMQAVLLVFISSTMFILVYCADFNQDDTYHDVLMSMCGKRAQQISALSILLTCYGINITFLVIIGDQYDRIFSSLLPEYLDEYWFLDRKFTIFMTSIIFIWPMCYAQRLDFLRHASILGMFAMLYVAFLTVYEHYRLDEAALAAEFSTSNKLNASMVLTNSTLNVPKHTTARSIHWFESLAIVPVLCFAYQTHEVIVPVYACMKQRSIGHFMKASIFGLVILFFLYNLVGAYGYLTFGANVGPDVMSLYNAKDPIVVIGIVALVIKFITTYPPLMFCGRGALDGLYGELRKLSTEEFKSTEKTRRIVITTIWFLSTVALAVFAPDISVTLQLLGSMASINVFVFPGMCLISLTRRLRRARQALLLDEPIDQARSQQRAKDYYLISGSYFALKKNAARRDKLRTDNYQQQKLTNGHSLNLNNRQHFTATFASLIEFENNISGRFGENSSSFSNARQPKINGYSSQSRHHRTQEEFEKLLLSNGGSSAQDLSCPYGRTINDSYEDYSDCDSGRNSKSDMISPILAQANNPIGQNGSSHDNAKLVKVLSNETDYHVSSSQCTMIKDPTLSARSAISSGTTNHHHQSIADQRQQSLQTNWDNGSTTGSILERLGSSIAPSTVAQIGISRCAANGLYLFSAFLITFGAFIFVLELANVFGFL